MKDTGAFQFFRRELFSSQHHVRPGIPVEGKVPISVGRGLDEGQGGMDMLVLAKVIHADAGVLRHLTQLSAEHIFTDFANEGRALCQLLEHGQYVARRAAGVGLQQRIPLLALSVFGEIDQQLAERNHIKTLFHNLLFHNPFVFLQPGTLMMILLKLAPQPSAKRAICAPSTEWVMREESAFTPST